MADSSAGEAIESVLFNGSHKINFSLPGLLYSMHAVIVHPSVEDLNNAAGLS